MSAAAAAAAMAAGVRDAGCEPVELPMADGGDGTLDVLLGRASRARVETLRVTGPLGGGVHARLGWLDQETAVVELAEAAGLRLLHGRLAPVGATSRGAGQLVAAALGGGAQRIIVGVGGSACTDGGAGLLAALGVELRDIDGNPIGPGGGALLRLASADASGLDPWLRRCRLDVAVDVDAPLLGPRGAATVYGPQKGASAADVQQLENGLRHLDWILRRDLRISRTLVQRPGSGAAGGCGYGLAAIGATLKPGAALVADAIGLTGALRGCVLALTAEGRLDQQTALGKAPMEVACRARRRDIECVAIAGQVVSLPEIFSRGLSLDDLAEPGEDSRRHARRLLRRAAHAATAPLISGEG